MSPLAVVSGGCPTYVRRQLHTTLLLLLLLMIQRSNIVCHVSLLLGVLVALFLRSLFPSGKRLRVARVLAINAGSSLASWLLWWAFPLLFFLFSYYN